MGIRIRWRIAISEACRRISPILRSLQGSAVIGLDQLPQVPLEGAHVHGVVQRCPSGRTRRPAPRSRGEMRADEQLAEPLLYVLGEVAHRAEVEEGELALRGDQQVAAVEVSVEQAVIEDLLEERSRSHPGERRRVHASGSEGLHVVHRAALDALEDEQSLGGEFPHHARYDDALEPFEVLAEPLGVRGLEEEVHLPPDHPGELVDDPSEVERPGLRDVPLDQADEEVEGREVVGDGSLDARPLHLEDESRPVQEPGSVSLGDAAGRKGFGLNLREHLGEGRAHLFLDDGAGLLVGEGRHLVLQLAEFLHEIGRHQIGAGGQHLARVSRRWDRGPRGPCGPAPGPECRRPARCDRGSVATAEAVGRGRPPRESGGTRVGRGSARSPAAG